RRDHSAGAADHSTARSVRNPRAPEFLHGRGAGAGGPPRRPAAQRRADRGRIARNRPPLARHSAHRRPAAPPRPRFRPCVGRGHDRRDGGGPRAGPARDRRARPGCDGPSLPDHDRRSLRRRAGRRGDARGGPQRAARHDRGRDRAFSHPTWPHRPDGTRTVPQRPRLFPSWAAGAAGQPGRPVRSGSIFEIMRHWIIAAAAALAAAVPAPALAQAPGPAPDYAKDSAWLCLRGRGDVCSTPLATTALNPNGYGSNGLSSVAKDPSVDCFYVYPTISNDRAMNSDLVVGREETLDAEVQFARLASVCRTFAPIYR